MDDRLLARRFDSLGDWHELTALGQGATDASVPAGLLALARRHLLVIGAPADPTLYRAAALGELPEAEAADRRAHLAKASTHWHILRIGPEVVDRARQAFPGDAIRTLDAIRLASVRCPRPAVPEGAV